MVTSNSRLAYLDCYELMDEALKDPKGLRVKFDAYGDAMYFRVRLHTARRIHRDDNAKTFDNPDHPMHGRSEYDKLVVRVRPDEGCTWVYIENNSVEGKVERLSELEPEPDNNPPRRRV